MKVLECAKLLEKSPQFVRIGLQRGILPFGYAVKMPDKWAYHISDKKVYEYIGNVTKRKIFNWKNILKYTKMYKKYWFI